MTKRCVMGLPDDSRRSAQLLRRIADTLGLPVDAFFIDVPATATIAHHDALLGL